MHGTAQEEEARHATCYRHRRRWWRRHGTARCTARRRRRMKHSTRHAMFPQFTSNLAVHKRCPLLNRFWPSLMCMFQAEQCSLLIGILYINIITRGFCFGVAAYFFRGFAPCALRAVVVNGVIFPMYEATAVCLIPNNREPHIY